MRLFHASLCALFVALAGTTAFADIITYNPAPTLAAGWTSCGSYAGNGCLTTAFFTSSSLDQINDTGVDGLFSQAWAAGDDGGYTLAATDQGLPDGVSFTVTQDAAEQFVAGGGGQPVVANNNVTGGGEVMDIQINGALPALGANQSYIWVQGLEVDYNKAGNIVSPYFVMDTATLSGFTCPTVDFPVTSCAPLYPFQNSGNAGFGDFYDQPVIGYQAPGSTQGWFDADAYLAIQNTDNDTITLLDGVNYGFNNYVSPEPGTWLLFLTGIGVVAFARRRVIGN